MLVMAEKRQKSSARAAKLTERDSTYVLKLVLYIIVGAQWAWFAHINSASSVPVPLGFIIGVIFAAHDHFRIDRKVEYAVLLVAALAGYVSQIGVFVTL